MLAVKLPAPAAPESAVGKKKPDHEPSLRQVNIRLAQSLFARVNATAEALGLDVAQFLRMLVKKHLGSYEAEAEEIRRREQQG